MEMQIQMGEYDVCLVTWDWDWDWVLGVWGLGFGVCGLWFEWLVFGGFDGWLSGLS